MKFINWVRSICAKPTALEIAARELEEHKRLLLNTQTSREYADGMCTYHMAAIDRLTNYLREVE